MDSEKYIVIPEIGVIPSFPVIPVADDEWRDGLLVRTPNWLGDAVMAIPAIMMLKRILPPCTGLFVLTPKGIAPLFEALPFVNRVVTVADPHAFMTARERLTVKRLQPGAAVLFNNSLRDAISLRLSRVPKLFGAKARGRSFLMTRAFDFPKRITAALNKPHQAAKYLAVACALGAPQWNGELPEFELDLYPEELSDDVLLAMRQKKILLVAGGAAYGAAKRWPAECFREIARRWIEEKQGFVIASGSKSERAIGDEILRGLPEKSCMNLAGKTDLATLMNLLKKADFCIANDSGVMHLAAVLGVSGIAPFGSTDPAATSPISRKWRILFDKKECAPCFKRVCPKVSRECFDSITPELLWQVLSGIPD